MAPLCQYHCLEWALSRKWSSHSRSTALDLASFIALTCQLNARLLPSLTGIRTMSGIFTCLLIMIIIVMYIYEGGFYIVIAIVLQYVHGCMQDTVLLYVFLFSALVLSSMIIECIYSSLLQCPQSVQGPASSLSGVHIVYPSSQRRS